MAGFLCSGAPASTPPATGGGGARVSPGGDGRARLLEEREAGQLLVHESQVRGGEAALVRRSHVPAFIPVRNKRERKQGEELQNEEFQGR